MDENKLRDRVVLCYDSESIIDILNLDIEVLVELLWEEIWENKEKFDLAYVEEYIDYDEIE